MALISLIVAMAKNNVIGIDNDLPWHIPSDLKRFKELTRGKPCIMGRKTFESIFSRIGKPLPERLNIIVSKNFILPNFDLVKIAASLDSAIEIARAEKAEEIMIIGGASIYEQALPIVDRLYLTVVDIEPQGDAHFPVIDIKEWRVVSEENLSDPIAYKNLILERV